MKAIYQVIETNVDGCGGDAIEYVEFDQALTTEEALAFKAALDQANEDAAESGEDADTADRIQSALAIFGKYNGAICRPPFESTIQF